MKRRAPRCGPLCQALLALLLAAPGGAWAAGTLSVFVFDGDGGDAPFNGASARIVDGPGGVAERSGQIRVKAEPGTYTVEIAPAPGQSHRTVKVEQVVITDREVTELIVTMVTEGDPIIDLEQRAEGEGPDLAEPTEVEGPQVTGTIQGRTLDPDGNGIDGVQVFVRGRPENARSDAAGRYTLLLPAGPQALSFIHPKYTAGRIVEVEVPADGVVTADVSMEPTGLALEDFVVTAPYIAGGVAELSAERRSTSNVVDVIGAEQMSRSGDGNAAAALKRVTGLTIVGGKYVYVRGMGERYSSTVLNDMFLPSPEPERRVVPLDMFPTSILGSVIIQKTSSPDQSAEFGGGVVQLRTRGVPEEPFVEASASVGWLTGTTLEDGLGYVGGGTDFLGIDDGARALPGSVQREFDRSGYEKCSGAGPRPGQVCVTQDDLDAAARLLPPLWGTEEQMAFPALGLSVGAGDRWAFSDETNFGAVGALSYDQGWQRVASRPQNSYKVGDAEGNLAPQEIGTSRQLERSIEMSGIVELALELDDHRLYSTSLLLRSTDDVAGDFAGSQFGNEENDIRVTRLQWIERQLFTQQLRGEHPLVEDLALKWHYGFSWSLRDEPNRRTYQYDKGRGVDEPFGLSSKPEANRRFFSALSETTHDLALSTRWAYGAEAEPGQDPVEYLELGGRLINRDRDVASLQFHLEGDDGSSATEGIDTLLAPENIGRDLRYRTENDTQVGDAYAAGLSVYAGYLMGQKALPWDLRLSAGLRVESATQFVQSFAPVGQNPPESRKENLDVLPSAGLAWAFVDDMQLRLGYGRTVNRAEFREQSEQRFDDVVNRQSIKGNPDIERAVIDHFDTRWEWYLTPRESVSAAFFYKSFTDPIEQVIQGGADKTITFRNAAGANNFGLELEGRRSFDWLWDGGESYYVAANLAIIQSEVDLTQAEPEAGMASEVQTSTRRALQGQSPYVLNFQLGYEDLDTNTFLTLLYNVAGERIVGVGTNGKPDIYEQPRHFVDVVFGYQLTDEMKLSLKAKNLLDSPVKETQGSETVTEYSTGRSLSAGLSWTL